MDYPSLSGTSTSYHFLTRFREQRGRGRGKNLRDKGNGGFKGAVSSGYSGTVAYLDPSICNAVNMTRAVLNQNKILEHEGELSTNASPSILVIGTMGNTGTAQTRLSVWGKKAQRCMNWEGKSIRRSRERSSIGSKYIVCNFIKSK